MMDIVSVLGSVLERKSQVDGKKEMMAIGLMNMAGSCTSSYVTTGSFSRSAVNYTAGCKSAVSNIVMALTVMVTILPLTPLFCYTPGVVLASIIIAAVLGLIDFPAAYFIRKVDKVDFLACVGASLGIIFNWVPLFYYTPEVVLASIINAAVLGSSDRCPYLLRQLYLLKKPLFTSPTLPT